MPATSTSTNHLCAILPMSLFNKVSPDNDQDSVSDIPTKLSIIPNRDHQQKYFKCRKYIIELNQNLTYLRYYSPIFVSPTMTQSYKLTKFQLSTMHHKQKSIINPHNSNQNNTPSFIHQFNDDISISSSVTLSSFSLKKKTLTKLTNNSSATINCRILDKIKDSMKTTLQIVS